MKFDARAEFVDTALRLVYLTDDLSFAVLSTDDLRESPESSVLLNEVELQLTSAGRVLYPDGYCPYFGWSATDAKVPASRRASLFVGGVELIPGVSHEVEHDRRWPVAANVDSGWICIGNCLTPSQAEAVEFAPNCVAVVLEGKLLALWLKPTGLPDLRG